MSDNPFKENIEKSKKVLKEHFKRRKQERKRDLDFPIYTTLELHRGDDWAIEDEEFDDFTKERNSFYEKLIWSDNTKEKKENKMKEYIAKKTVKLRYKVAVVILKHLTPILYKKIDSTIFTNRRVFQLKSDNAPNTIRPSTKFMKDVFNGKSVKGAEIGVERGRNSKNILNELNIGELYLIDVWDHYKGIYVVWSLENYNHVLRKFKDDKRVKIIKNYSEYAVNEIEDNSLDFVYIDANHNYKYVFQDINLWYPKVKEGGIISGHDVCIPDTLKAVKDFCDIKNIKFTTEIPDWYFIKPKR